MGFTVGVVKYLVFICNLVFAIAGLALLVVGILFKLEFNDITQSIEDDTFAVAPTLVITVGAIIFVIAFFGCCGAIKENSCMLTTYAVILIAIFILQVAVGIFAFLEVKDEDGLRERINKDLTKAFDKYKDNDKSVLESVDLLQQTLKCCGVNSPLTWGGKPPGSCCKDNPKNCQEPFPDGCAPTLFNEIKNNVKILGYVALGISATEVIGAIFALCLTCSMKKNRR